ncbi:MAG: OB-fold domain-containing protein [Bacillota bacterium]
MGPMMYAYKCTACGKLYHPSRAVCRECGGREFEEIPLEGEGTLLTYTRVYALPEGYMKPWIAFGIVEFPNGLRVSGQMATDDLATGMKVRATVGLVKEGVGKDYYGFIFEKAS